MFRPRKSYFRRIEKLPELETTADVPEQQKRIDRFIWSKAIEDLSRSSTPALCLDFCEAYANTIDITQVTFDDIRVLAIFGATIYNFDHRKLKLHEALAYLNTCVAHLPLELGGNRDLAFMAGYAREYAGRARTDLGDLDDALRLYIDAFELYRKAENRRGAATVLGQAITIASALNDGDTLDWLSRQNTDKQHPDEPDTVSIFRFVNDKLQGKHRAGPDGKPLPRIATYTFLHDNHAPVDAAMEIIIKPINFTPNPDNDLPDDAIYDVEVRRPFGKVDWIKLTSSRLRYPSEILVARIVSRHGDEYYAVAEEILQHPLLDWIASAPDRWDVSKRTTATRHLLWQWAGRHELFTWLAKEWETYCNQYGPKIASWPFYVKIGLGLEFAAVAVSPQQQSAGRRNWFAECAAEMLVGVLNRSMAIPPGLTPQSAFEARSYLARCYEILDDLAKAVNLYQANVNFGFGVRHQSVDHKQRKAIQQLVGMDANRLNRARFRIHQFPPPDEVKSQIFWTNEWTRARILVDRISGIGLSMPSVESGDASKHSLSSEQLTDIRNMHSDYAQLSLVQSFDSFIGFWLAATCAMDGKVAFARIDWDEPLKLHDRMEDFLDQGITIGALPRERVRSNLKNLIGLVKWVDREVLSLFPDRVAGSGTGTRSVWVSPTSYLISIPWSFCSVARNRIRSLPRRERLVLGAAFCAGSVNAGRERMAGELSPAKFRVFVDPGGDLPEARSAITESAEFAAGLRNDFKSFCGIEASAARFLESVREADIIVFMGHGDRTGEKTSQLVFSLGRSVSPEQISEKGVSRSGRARLAVVLSCWGGQLTTRPESWEAEGIANGLKVAGFEFVITALWPVSPRMAALFLKTLLGQLLKEASIEEAFAQAYDDLIDTFGLYAVMLEAASIQLIG